MLIRPWALVRISSNNNPWQKLWTRMPLWSRTQTERSFSPDPIYPIYCRWSSSLTWQAFRASIWPQRNGRSLGVRPAPAVDAKDQLRSTINRRKGIKNAGRQSSVIHKRDQPSKISSKQTTCFIEFYLVHCAFNAGAQNIIKHTFERSKYIYKDIV